MGRCDDGCWCLLYFDRRALRFMVNDEVVVMVISEMNDGVVVDGFDDECVECVW